MKYTKLFQSNFRDVFHFSTKKTLLNCLFSWNICEATRKARALQAARAYRRQEFWRETHIPLWLLIGRIIFLTIEKKIFRDYDWTFQFFFSRVKNIVRSSDWLELICVWRFFISFQWVYLSIYIHCTGGTWHCIIINNYCIPRARMGSEWIAHEGERNNCFSKIQLVGKKCRDKTT